MRAMSGVALRFRSTWPVYEIRSENLDRAAVQDARAVGWRRLKPSTIERLFADDPERAAEFKRFVETGSLGIVLEGAGGWISYGWMATPGGAPPPHLGSLAAGSYWIYYCRTRENQRGHGHYRRALLFLTSEAEHSEGGPTVVRIDTRIDNLPARRAIERIGFRPAGVAYLYRIPKTSLSWSRWHPDRPHPGE